MVLRGFAVAGLMLLLATATPTVEAKPKRAKLLLRATPRVLVVPGNVLFTAELRDVVDGETLHCLTEAWDWGDGSASEEGGGACEPWVAGTPVKRRFTADHEFRRESRPRVTLRLLKDGAEVAQASVSLILQERGTNSLKVRRGEP